MYNWVTRRKIARTEGPSYPARAAQTVDAAVALWAPAFAILLACSMTPARAKLDARYYDAPTYPVRAAQTVDANVAAWVPAFYVEAASECVRARPSLDVRRYKWIIEEPSWISGILVTPPTVAQTWPAFQVLGERTRERARLDVRLYEWLVDESAWITSIPAPTAPTVAQTLPAFQPALQFRTQAARLLDPFRSHSVPDIFGVPDDWITWVPLQDHGGLTRGRAKLDVRGYEWSQPAWITVSLAAPATAFPWLYYHMMRAR